MAFLVAASGNTEVAHGIMIHCRSHVQTNGNLAVMEIYHMLGSENPELRVENQLPSSYLKDFIGQVSNTINNTVMSEAKWKINKKSFNDFRTDIFDTKLYNDCKVYMKNNQKITHTYSKTMGDRTAKLT